LEEVAAWSCTRYQRVAKPLETAGTTWPNIARIQALASVALSPV
jgi:hypothetical protein